MISHTVRTDERVGAVTPVRKPMFGEESVEREKRGPAFTSFRNEDLVERYRRAGVSPLPEGSVSPVAGRAVNAYVTVHLVNEREAVADMLGVSLYA